MLYEVIVQLIMPLSPHPPKKIIKLQLVTSVV
jgi:hypothetical protein